MLNHREIYICCWSGRAHYCVAAGTPINTADGVAVPIEQIVAGDEVLARGQTGTTVRTVKTVIASGVKECVELLFSDGRLLTCTPEHRILTADGRWVTAGDLVVGESEVTVGVEYPLSPRVPPGAWKLDTAATLGYDLEMGPRALAFARILGYLLTDGTVTVDSITSGRGSATVFMGHALDADAMSRDIRLLTGKDPSHVKERNITRINLPRPLRRAFIAVGVTPGRRVDGITSLPPFLLDEDCPLPIVREFLGGLFGGDGKAPCVSYHMKKVRAFHGVGFCAVRTGRVVRPQVEAFKAELLPLIARCGVDTSQIAFTQATKWPCEKTATGSAEVARLKATGVQISERLSLDAEFDQTQSHEIAMALGMSLIVPFAENIGFRYCSHKAMRLTAALAYFRSAAVQLRQTQRVGAHARLLHNSFSIVHSIFRAKIYVAIREQLMPAVFAWRPTQASLLTPTQISTWITVAESLEQFKTAPFFSEKRTREKYKGTKRKVGDTSIDSLPAPPPAPTDGASSSPPPTAVIRYGVHKDAREMPTFQVKLVGRRYVGYKTVYDLEVPAAEGDDYASFMAAGVLVHNCSEMGCELAVTHDDCKVCPITAKQYPLEFQTTYEQGNISNERRMMTRVVVTTKRKRARGGDGLSISAASARASALALGSGGGGASAMLCSPSPSPSPTPSSSSISPASIAASSSPSPSSFSSHSTFFPPPFHPHHRSVSAGSATAAPSPPSSSSSSSSSSSLSLSVAASPHFGYHNEVDALHAICAFIARCLPARPDVAPLSRARTMELARELLVAFRVVHRIAGPTTPREYTLFVHVFVSLHVMAKGGEGIGDIYLVRGHADVTARIPDDPATSFAILRRQHAFHTRMVSFFNSIVSRHYHEEIKHRPVIKD